MLQRQPTYRYIRDGICYRDWGPNFSFSIVGVTIEGIEAQEETKVPTWPFVAYANIDALDCESALRDGRFRCGIAIDIAVLLSGYRVELGADGVRATDPAEIPPGIVEMPITFSYRSGVADSDERESMFSQSAIPTISRSGRSPGVVEIRPA
jgi:hypothetical protein